MRAPAQANTAAPELPDLSARPRDARAWLVALVSLVLAASAMFSRYLFADSFYDLYDGRLIVRTGLQHRNVATVTAHGAAWPDQQWLAHVLYYEAWRAGGYRAVAAFSAVLVTAGFAIVMLLMLRRGVPSARAFAWTLAAFATCMGNTGIRAQSFAYPCLAAVMWLLVTDSAERRPRRRTWLIVPVLMLWANTHGSILLGAGLAAAYAVYRAVKAITDRDRSAGGWYLLLAAASVSTVICTPYGTGIVRYYRRFIWNPALRHNIVEWGPPSPLYPYSWAFFGLLAACAITLVVAWRRGTRPDPVLTAATVLLLALAMSAVRNQAWFGLGGSLLAADTLARSSAGQAVILSQGFRRVLATMLAGLAAAAVVTLAVTPDSQFFSQVPRRAIDVAGAIVVRHPTLRVLGDDYSGTAMLWLKPGLLGRVGFDDRYELYTGRDFAAYTDFLNVRGNSWQRVTRGYGIVVVSRWHPALVRALTRLPGWRLAYQRHGSIVLVRTAG